ncbi:chitin synthase chs-2-like [Rhinophrynus dorsalis]
MRSLAFHAGRESHVTLFIKGWGIWREVCGEDVVADDDIINAEADDSDLDYVTPLSTPSTDPDPVENESDREFVEKLGERKWFILTMTGKEQFRRSWDPFLVKPVRDEEEKTQRSILFFINLFCALVGLLVLASGFFSKICLLFLIMMIGEDSLNLSNKPFGVLITGIMLVVPNILIFIKSMWKLAFTKSKSPPKLEVLVTCTAEGLVALGSSMLTIVAMPHFNIISNVMILNSICFVPSITQIIQRVKKRGWKLIISIFSFSFLLIGYIMFFTGYLYMTSSKIAGYLFIAFLATVLVSLNWREKCNVFKKTEFQYIRPENDTRNILYIYSSGVKILVTMIVVGSYVPAIGEDWTKLKSISQREINLLISLLALQSVASASCHWLGVVACKMHYVKRSFAAPLIGTTFAVVAALLTIFIYQYKTEEEKHGNAKEFSKSIFCNNIKLNDTNSAVQNLLLEVNHNICQTIMTTGTANIVMLFISGFSWYLGFALCTFYVWKFKVQRIERTTQLFVRRLYEAAFIDQSMLLNIRAKLEKPIFSANHERATEKVKVYLCATMWHETFDEMLKILTSMFRLDKYKSKAKKDTFDFEAHIFFDDSFIEKTEDQVGKKKRSVNIYVEYLVAAFDEVYRVFTCDKTKVFSRNSISNLIMQKIMVTPYGGRLCYKFPHGNLLYVHLKDKQRIRHKKRWSQIMYLFYLLGWKLFRRHANSAENVIETTEKDQIQAEMEKEKSNTYVLALDGDTDFQPSALMLLVDRLRMYPGVGAACGRIHPTGMGPMVWYQKFEYAVGHWLQKSAEHVFGCVLCSPGCFSLFRASALMDDNVMKKYSKEATEASQFVQYDQGEDRWLCTLLLQQGWRVEYNAASDAYTNAPQEFEEFYNQRRRWGPSTMANTLDLLHSGSETSKKNPSLSFPYILYQTVTMGASILSPATVCLMIAGAFTFLFGWSGNVSIVAAITPPALYIGICYLTKPNTQIKVAALLSIGYAFLMTATFLCIIADMTAQKTFMTPTGIFLVSMSIIFIVTALLHPQEFSLLIYGLIYIICVPSGYLLLTIYSLVNMHVVSWGTRETAAPKEKKKEKNKRVKHKNIFKCLKWDIEVQVYDRKCKTTEENLKDIEQPVITHSQENENNVVGIQEWTYEEEWIQQLQQKSSYNVLHEVNLEEEEIPFWKELIKQYLEPINEDKQKQAEILRDLMSLRNKVTFIFFMINLLWIAATFFLQMIGSSINIIIPKVDMNGHVSTTEFLYVEPISLMFLLAFASLLLVQFGGLLYHSYSKPLDKSVGDIDGFLWDFERQCHQVRVDCRDWVPTLARKLTGRAADSYRAIPD